MTASVTVHSVEGIDVMACDNRTSAWITLMIRTVYDETIEVTIFPECGVDLSDLVAQLEDVSREDI